MIDFIRASGPFWIGTLALNLGLFLAAWWILSQKFPNLKVAKSVALSLAGLMTIHAVAMNSLTTLQAERLAKVKVEAAVKAIEANPQAPAAPQGQPQITIEQLKANFLQTVDATALQPDTVTPDSKRAFYQQFAPLFPRGEADRVEFARNIIHAYECQRAVFEDALATLKSKKVVRGKMVEACESEAGTFFNRERLIPTEVVKANGEMLQKLAKAKPGDKELPSEEALRGALDQQIRRIDGARKLLE